MLFRLSKLLLLVGFAAFLVLPTAEMALHFAPRFEGAERRARAPRPLLSWEGLRGYPQAFEAYAKDEFGFRDSLIHAYSLLQVRAFHRSSVPNVIIGNDGWLFYAGYDDGADLSDFQGKAPLTHQELAARRAELEGRQAALTARGIRYLFMVVPNKHTLYEEELPATVGRRQRGNHLDQLHTALVGSPLNFLDLRGALSAAKASRRGPLYYKTDSHWNSAGAFVGFQALMAKLGLAAPAPELFTFAEEKREGGDLANMLALAKGWPDTEVTFTVAPHAKLAMRVYLVGDSFSEQLEPFLREAFDEVIVSRVSLGPGFSLPHILDARPSVVIDERVERYLLKSGLRLSSGD